MTVILVKIIGNVDLKKSTILAKKWFQMLRWVQDVPLQIDKLQLLKQRYVKICINYFYLKFKP